MSGRVVYLSELDEESFALLPDKRILLEPGVLETISDYTRSQPTGPSPGDTLTVGADATGSAWRVYHDPDYDVADFALLTGLHVHLPGSPLRPAWPACTIEIVAPASAFS